MTTAVWFAKHYEIIPISSMETVRDVLTGGADDVPWLREQVRLTLAAIADQLVKL